MIDLKPAYDAAQKRIDELNAVANRINEKLLTGSEEDLEEAIGMQPELEAAEAAASKAQSLYEGLKAAANRSDSGALQFVPVPDEGQKPKTDAKVLSAEEFGQLDQIGQFEFAQKGGRVE